MIELSDRLAYWTAPHPNWQPDADWPEDVTCVLYVHPETLVLIDPLVREDVDPGGWASLDEAVRRSRTSVSILLTAPWHERSTRAVVDRYSGRVWAASPARGRLGDVPELEMLPPGIWSFVPAGVDEGQVAFLIEPEQTLIVGEIFAGVNRGLELRPSPATNDEKAFLASLAELEALPIRRVLVGHGSPVLEGGNEAISAALRAFTKS